MSERIYNVAVIGYGLSSQVFMIPFLNGARLKLYAIVQRNAGNRNDAEHDHPNVKIYRSSDKMLKDKAVDLVVVATPPLTHFTLCTQAMEAGKHVTSAVVVCEKPFTMNMKEADSLIALAADRKLVLTVFHNRRWDADFNTVYSLNRDERLGRIVEFESHFDWHAPLPRPGWESTWRTQADSGAAVLYDLGSHLIDQALQLFGMPQQITAFLYHQRENGAKWGDADSMTILLQYDNGPFVTLKASIMNVELEQLRFWIRGTKGTYKKHHLDVQEPQITQGQNPESSGFGLEPESHYGILSTINEAGAITSTPFSAMPVPTYKTFWNMLTEALDGKGASLPVKPESAAEVIRVIELAMQSVLEKRSIPVV